MFVVADSLGYGFISRLKQSIFRHRKAREHGSTCRECCISTASGATTFPTEDLIVTTDLCEIKEEDGGRRTERATRTVTETRRPPRATVEYKGPGV